MLTGNAGRRQHYPAGHGDQKHQGKDIHHPLAWLEVAKVNVWTMANGLAQRGEGILRG